MTPSQRILEIAKHLEAKTLPLGHLCVLLTAEAQAVADMERKVSDITQAGQRVLEHTDRMAGDLAALSNAVNARPVKVVDGNTKAQPDAQNL